MREMSVPDRQILERQALIRKMCQEFGMSEPGEEVIAKLVHLADHDGNGVLDEAEFEKFLRVWLMAVKTGDEQEPAEAWARAMLADKEAFRKELRPRFEKVDTGSFGRIQGDQTLTLISELCAEFGLPLQSEVRVRSLLDKHTLGYSVDAMTFAEVCAD